MSEEGLEVYMTRSQIDAAWSRLPLRLAAIGLLTALQADEGAN